MHNPWPFDQPRNCGVVTLRQIMEDGVAVLLVTHDEDDHGWQFLDGSENLDPADARHVCLEHVVNTDPTLYEVADIAPGWIAWRETPSDPWVREPRPADWGEGV
ncbi:hypothetical protein J2X16_003032 [Pelomonas aquatica]|uniref:DUF2185 domain-containing protein n=1 Tax=Pelomonas aquatica TaxID=431058 RepID=A0ABU1ZB63_9BURK|nr:hypothetical protein [Pelomonas aquatica]